MAVNEPVDKDTWREWSQLVFHELKRLNGNDEAIIERLGKIETQTAILLSQAPRVDERSKELENRVRRLEVELATVKTKASLLGGVAGIAGGLLGFLVETLRK